MPATKAAPDRAVFLQGRTAADLMTANPVSIREDAPVKEAIAFLVDRRITGAPVIDDAGRPVGVLSQTDLIIHDREDVEYVVPAGIEFGTPLPRSWWDEFQIERVDATPVRDLMTPAVFSVGIDTPAWAVVEQMRELNVHRLFVVDEDGVMVGVVTAMDVVRHLAAGG